jgi:hypothetical protein
VIITLVFEKNANFFAENWQKSQKIVIITSTPDWAILAYWVIVEFGGVFENYRSRPNVWSTPFNGKSYA